MPTTPDTDNPYDDFETIHEVRGRASEQIEMLGRSKDPVHQELARKLASCVERSCHSGTCPRCMREYRLLWIDDASHLLKNEWQERQSFAEIHNGGFLADHSYVGLLTFVSPDTFIEPGQLLAFDPNRFKSQIGDTINRATDHQAIVVGAIDYALTSWTLAGKTAWQPHIHGLMFCGRGTDAAQTTLEHYSVGNEYVSKPILIRPLSTTPERAAGYVIKAYFEKRIPYISPVTGAERARHVPLPIWARRELAVFLDRTPIEDRLFLLNCSRSEAKGLYTKFGK